MYFPIDAGTSSGAALVVRAAGDPESFALPIQKVIQQMNRELVVSDVLTMNQIINKSSLDANFEATLLAAFAGISLLLAAVGLFGAKLPKHARPGDKDGTPTTRQSGLLPHCRPSVKNVLITKLLAQKVRRGLGARSSRTQD